MNDLERKKEAAKMMSTDMANMMTDNTGMHKVRKPAISGMHVKRRGLISLMLKHPLLREDISLTQKRSLYIQLR